MRLAVTHMLSLEKRTHAPSLGVAFCVLPSPRMKLMCRKGGPGAQPLKLHIHHCTEGGDGGV